MPEDLDPGSPKVPGDLTIVVAERGTATAIELYGEYDLAALSAIRPAFSMVLDGDPEGVVLDLSGLGFIDSSGLLAIVELSKRAAAQHTRLEIIRGPRAVQRAFEITGLAARLPVIDKQLTDSHETPPRLSAAAGSDGLSLPPAGAGRRPKPAGATLTRPVRCQRRPETNQPSTDRPRRPGAKSRP